jgi:hypothetical protein
MMEIQPEFVGLELEAAGRCTSLGGVATSSMLKNAS